jgi:CubicO group peptidase (beta-lactamase class C family)
VDEQELRTAVAEAAEDLGVPGVAVGIYYQGAEYYAQHGVTSTENPLPVDEATLFQFGSTGKTFTATALMRLVEAGKVELDAPVRRYVPELALKDESVAEKVTVLQLLNHTAGWSGDLFDNTGTGDDALARLIERMANLEQVTPLGAVVSYNNASLSLAGRLIEKVTGQTYEQAMKELVLEPLGLDRTYFFPTDIMTRRFVVGHNKGNDGQLTVARPWALPRGANPAGGITANAGDLIKWARFHLGDGRASDGTRLLSERSLKSMQQATAQSPGNAIGDAVGITWWLRDVDGVRMVSHGGNTIGQDSGFDMVPERDFALVTLTNASPNGGEFNERIRRWALEAFLGITERNPEPVRLSEAELVPYTGMFETHANTAEITAQDGLLVVRIETKPEILAELTEGEEGPQPPLQIGLLGPGDDRYVFADGPLKGKTGYFVRADTGAVSGVHLGGRLATRTGGPV